MKYINELREGERISEIYLCKEKKTMMTKAGKPYDSVTLQDKTGTLDAKIWDPGSAGIEDFDALDYVAVTGDITSYQGNLQMSVKRVRKCRPDEYDPKDYLPVSGRNNEEMYGELLHFVDSVENPYYNRLLHMFFDDAGFAEKFQFHSAAKSVHHGFVGGLLEHTLSVTRNCDFFAKNYPFLKRDLLITSAIFHDVGKLKELSNFPENDYTDEGQLLGHIIIGVEWIGEKIREMGDFPAVLENELKHCIIAHHGELEFGSPKKPALVEALALSFADNIDAKMETFFEATENVSEGNTKWLGFNRFLESNIRRTSVE